MGKLDGKKRLRLSDEGVKKDSVNTASSTNSHGQPNYLPHSQSAFLARLSSFSSIHNWRITSSEEINAVAWAKRGWSCVGRDRVACNGGCEAQLIVRLDDELSKGPEGDHEHDPEDDEDAGELAEERHKLLVEKYKELIVSSHSAHCPWKRRGCDILIQRLALLNPHSSVRDLQTRYDGIGEIETGLPSNIRLGPDEEQQRIFNVDKLRSDADVFSGGSTKKWDEKNRRAFILALCGWEPAVDAADADVVECRSCFRRLGLWLYRPKSPKAEPTMEHLDAVDSHLDYCPWKSSEAQQTQIEIEDSKHFLAGWELLARNVDKESSKITNNKKRAQRADGASGMDGSTDNTDAISVTSQLTTTSQMTTSDDKEKRAKALMKKIRDLKKPFNVKALLKKKESSTVKR